MGPLELWSSVALQIPYLCKTANLQIYQAK